MIATILKGSVATQTTINIINTFVEIRELSRAIARVPEVVDENEKKSLLKRSGEIISNVLASDSTSLESETEIELNLAIFAVFPKFFFDCHLLTPEECIFTVEDRILEIMLCEM